MLTLLTRDGTKTGNAILYGGSHPMNPEVQFYVETDFGNHMKLSWNEINELWTIGRFQSYEDWRADRQRLHDEKMMLVDMPTLLDTANSLRASTQGRVSPLYPDERG